MASELLNEKAKTSFFILFPENLSKDGKNLIKNHAIIAQIISEL
jgi:hypothetical protein